MEDGKSLLDIKSSPWNYFKRLPINKNFILPFLGFLLLLICLIFIFSILLESGRFVVCCIYLSVRCFVDGPCPAQWRSFNKSCYKLVVNYTDIKECRKDCFKEGADLASIHSQEENQLIVSLLEDSPAWIAGSITEEDGEFMWLDGSPWDFTNWDQGNQD